MMVIVNSLIRSSRLGQLLITLQTRRTMGSSSSQQTKHADFVNEKINSNCIMVFSKSTCGYCTMAKRTFHDLGANYEVVELNTHNHGNEIQDELVKLTGSHTVPQVFVNGKFLGGGTETRNLYKSGELSKLISECCSQQAKL